MVGFSFGIRASPSEQIAAPSRPHPYYSNRNRQTHAFQSRIAFHAARLPGLKVSNHYTSPLPPDVLGRDFDSWDRITAAAVPEDLIARRARVYVCGTSGMMKAFAEGPIARGVPNFDIFREMFTAPTGPLADDGKNIYHDFLSVSRDTFRLDID
jgi:ferredoxin-NADP reductase